MQTVEEYLIPAKAVYNNEFPTLVVQTVEKYLIPAKAVYNNEFLMRVNFAHTIVSDIKSCI